MISLVAGLAASFLGCSGERMTASPERGWVRANVAGQETASGGSGHFAISGGHSGIPKAFTITAWGIGAGESLLIWRNNEHAPTPGRYAFTLPAYDAPNWEGFAAVYDRGVVDGAAQVYVARSGEITLTRISDDRVEGTFRFTGVLFCQRPSGTGSAAPYYGTCSPKDVDVNGPTLEVSGSFSVGPQTDTTVHLTGGAS